MLTCGLQTQTLKQTHITLFDEIETGLEPSRIARLLKYIKEDKTGQYFFTTHSPVVLRELTINDLYVVQYHKGKTDIIRTNKAAIADSVQGNIRSGAEAFLSAKVIVCEGATELGLCRGLDNYWLEQDKPSFSYRGVACIDARGVDNIKNLASNINELGYAVSIIMDSDSPQKFSSTDADDMRRAGIEIITWEGEVSVEERIIADLPWKAIVASVNLAKSIHGERIIDQIGTQYSWGFERDCEKWTDTEQIRNAIGKAANKGEWFKRQDRAEAWFGEFKDYLNLPEMAKKDFMKKASLLRKWIDHE